MTGWLAAVTVAAAVALAGRRAPASRLTEHVARAGPGPPTGGARRNPAAVIAIALLAGSAVVALHLSVVVVGVVALGGLVALRGRRSRFAAQARRDAASATVEVTFALAAELRAGRTPAQALAAVAEIAGPLEPALTAAQLAVAVGADPAEELRRAADAVPGAERLGAVAAAWAVAESAGGRIAVVLERLCESMDSDDGLRLELDAAMAGPRATMAVLAGLPVLGLALGQAMGAHPLALLLHRPLGWALLSGAGGLDALGLLATRAIASRALPR